MSLSINGKNKNFFDPFCKKNDNQDVYPNVKSSNLGKLLNTKNKINIEKIRIDIKKTYSEYKNKERIHQITNGLLETCNEDRENIIFYLVAKITTQRGEIRQLKKYTSNITEELDFANVELKDKDQLKRELDICIEKYLSSERMRREGRKKVKERIHELKKENEIIRKELQKRIHELKKENEIITMEYRIIEQSNINYIEQKGSLLRKTVDKYRILSEKYAELKTEKEKIISFIRREGLLQKMRKEIGHV